MATYARTQGGQVVHYSTCVHVRSSASQPWEWAEGRSAEEIGQIMRQFGYRPCGFCQPRARGRHPMTAAVLTPIDHAALDLLMGRIDLPEAVREVRPWFADHTEREIDAKLLLHANALLAKGVRP